MNFFKRAFLEANQNNDSLNANAVVNSYSEQRKDIEIFHISGLEYYAKKDDEVLALSDGSETESIGILAGNKINRPRNLKKGEIMLYHPENNRKKTQHIHLKKDNSLVLDMDKNTIIIKKKGDGAIIKIDDIVITMSKKTTTIKCKDIVLDADTVTVPNGDIIVPNGDVVASGKSLVHHTHTQTNGNHFGGGATTTPPN